MILKKLTFLCLLSFVNCAYSFTEQTISVEHAAIIEFRAISTSHYVVNARNVASILVIGLPSQCSKGLFYKADVNNVLHSMFLAAYAASTKFEIVFDVDQSISPWGETGYCAVTQIKYK